MTKLRIPGVKPVKKRVTRARDIHKIITNKPVGRGVKIKFKGHLTKADLNKIRLKHPKYTRSTWKADKAEYSWYNTYNNWKDEASLNTTSNRWEAKYQILKTERTKQLIKYKGTAVYDDSKTDIWNPNNFAKGELKANWKELSKNVKRTRKGDEKLSNTAIMARNYRERNRTDGLSLESDGLTGTGGLWEHKNYQVTKIRNKLRKLYAEGWTPTQLMSHPLGKILVEKQGWSTNMFALASGGRKGNQIVSWDNQEVNNKKDKFSTHDFYEDQVIESTKHKDLNKTDSGFPIAKKSGWELIQPKIRELGNANKLWDVWGIRNRVESLKGTKVYNVLKDIYSGINATKQSAKKWTPYLNKIESLRRQGLASMEGSKVVAEIIKKLKAIKKDRRSDETNQLLKQLKGYRKTLAGAGKGRKLSDETVIELFSDQNTFWAFHYDELGYTRSARGKGVAGTEWRGVYAQYSEEEKERVRDRLTTVDTEYEK